MDKADEARPGPRDGPRRRYSDLYDELAAADRRQPLEPADLERLAVAAYLIGRAPESIACLTRAHQECVARGETARGVRCAFWLAFLLGHEGERVLAAGWTARARRLLAECGEECVERGYLLLPAALEMVAAGDIAGAERTFAEAARTGDRYGDPDLANLARQGQGRALINQGRVAEGTALLDEVMVAITGGEVSPMVVGTVYCSAIEACFEMLDMRRAHDWTEVLTRWCSSHPDLVPYRGLCLVRRAEMMVLHGNWSAASDEAQQVCQPGAHRSWTSARGAAFYQLAELHRLRGELGPAEEAYRLASESGRIPQPGLALLRLAQGRLDAARAAICRAVDEARDTRSRVRFLAAAVEVFLASSDQDAARAAADRLSGDAATLGTPYPLALAAHARGAVLLAAGDARASLAELRDAWTIWRELDMPYDAARTSVLVAQACRSLGDADGARLELEAARAAFTHLGAPVDRRHVESLLGRTVTSAVGLTTREVEVLRLVASGQSNKAIAGSLHISEKTVARHLSNIFTKLDLPSRAAATAFAFTHHLV